MFNQQYAAMTRQESVIRKIFMYGKERAREVGYDNVFDYSLGNPSVAPPEIFRQTLLELLEKEDPIAIHGYSPGQGIPSVREAIAHDLNRRFGSSYDAGNIFMAVGATGALAHALRSVLVPNRNDEVVTFAPYFPEYYHYVGSAGGKLIVVPADIDTFQINFDAFAESITPNTRAVLVNSPNNPSGIVYTEETVLRLAEILLEKGKTYGHLIYLISDEPYREIVFSGVKAPFIANYYPYTIVCYSYSKSLSIPGERIGYCAINSACPDYEIFPEMCAQISRCIGHNCPPSLIQLAVGKTAGITSDLSVYETNKDILYKELTRIGFTCVEPGGTFYMFPRALENDAEAFCARAREMDLLLVPSDTFGVPGHFRISYCIPTEKVYRSIPVFEKLYASYQNA